MAFWRGRREPDDDLGRRGEKLAARHLRRAGCRILARNYRCPVGEVDLVVLDEKRRPPEERAVVFVEVKTRASDDDVAPESAVDFRKQQRITRVARYYLARHEIGDLRVRFDVVSVVIHPGRRPRVRHIPDAFGPE